MSRPVRYIIKFGPDLFEEAPAEEFGNKAEGLATMAGLGIPVPPGFSLNVCVCEDYYNNGKKIPEYLPDLLNKNIAFIEKATGSGFGSSRRPLLISVRSGAPVSMPGIMDTLLNVGLNRETLRGLIFLTGNPRFAWDTYRRFMQNFGEIVFGQDPAVFQSLLLEKMKQEAVPDEVELDSGSLKELVSEYERVFFTGTGRRFPEDVYEQLILAVEGVIKSWHNPRAEAFRKIHTVGEARGTGVTVQAMVFGNMGSHSGAGVAFTRNPWQGDNELVVDFKFGAQGEDVVSGDQSATTQKELSSAMPGTFEELRKTAKKLEMHFRDMQDIEFTVQEGELYLLQTRSGKRSPYAALKIAVNMCQEGIISPADVMYMIRDIDIDAITLQRVKSKDYPVAIGIPASSGVASGKIVLSSQRAETEAKSGSDTILVRETASPDDLPGINVARGILTARGARTSHAAVVARQMGKICVVNCSTLEINASRHRCYLGGQELREGEIITIDGNSGMVYIGAVEVIDERPEDLVALVRSWENTIQM